MTNPEEQALHRDWEAVGSYLRQAMEEAAEGVGSDAAEHVLETMGEGVLPDAEALIYLERLEPGIAEWIIVRSSEIQRETHDRELAEVTSLKHRAKSLAGGILRLV